MSSPDVFQPPNLDRCPIFLYKFYEAKRPENFSNTDDPFYVAAVTNNKNPKPNEQWFLRGPIGKNKLANIMKKMAVTANLPGVGEKRFTNTSVRKTLVQTMTDNNVPDNLQVYVTGHKNTQSLNNYRTLNDTQKHAISHLLTNPGNPVNNVNKSLPNPSSTAVRSSATVSSPSFPLEIEFPSTTHSSTAVTLRQGNDRTVGLQQSHISVDSRMAASARGVVDHLSQSSESVRRSNTNHDGQMESIFAGSMIRDCNMTVNVTYNYNTVNNHKRRRIVIESDSD